MCWRVEHLQAYRVPEAGRPHAGEGRPVVRGLSGEDEAADEAAPALGPALLAGGRLLHGLHPEPGEDHAVPLPHDGGQRPAVQDPVGAVQVGGVRCLEPAGERDVEAEPGLRRGVEGEAGGRKVHPHLGPRPQGR